MKNSEDCNGSEQFITESNRVNIKMPELLTFKMITEKKYNFSFSLPDKINEENSTFKTTTKKNKGTKSKGKSNLKSRQSSRESVYFIILIFFNFFEINIYC